jgi:hypothetical protein
MPVYHDTHKRLYARSRSRTDAVHDEPDLRRDVVALYHRLQSYSHLSAEFQLRFTYHGDLLSWALRATFKVYRNIRSLARYLCKTRSSGHGATTLTTFKLPISNRNKGCSITWRAMKVITGI